jgi:hypothetical protein
LFRLQKLATKRSPRGEGCPAVKIVVADLMSAGLDGSDQVGVSGGTVPNQEEGGMSLVPGEDRQHLPGVNWVGTIVKRQRNMRLIRVHSPDDARGNNTKDRE